MKKTLSLGLALLLAIGFSAPTILNGQDAEDQDNAASRLERIEQAIQRLEEALPEDQIEQILEQVEGGVAEGGLFLQDVQMQERYMIGVRLGSADAEEGEEVDMLVVGEVMEGMPAAEAGLNAGDRIVSINGQEVEGAGELIELIQANGEEPLVVAVERGDELMEFELVAVKQEAAVPAPGIAWELAEGIELPEGFEFPEGFQLPDGIEMPEGARLPHFRVIPPVRAEDIQIDPQLIFGGGEMREELDELRSEMDEMRAQMEELTEQLRGLRRAMRQRQRGNSGAADGASDDAADDGGAGDGNR